MGSWIFVAVGIGVAVATQVAILGRASGAFHPLAISLALQVAGILAGGAWAFSQRAWPQVGTVTIQWWWLPLGALGWGVVAALGLVAARAGVTATLAVVVAAQLIAGLGIDGATGRLVLGLRHPVGVVLIVAGVILATRR